MFEETATANILLCLGEQQDVSSITLSFDGILESKVSPSNLVEDIRNGIRADLSLCKRSINDQSFKHKLVLGDNIENEIVENIDPDGVLPRKRGKMNRKERNRIHAKLTRDRKKVFTSRLQDTIQNLKFQNETLRSQLFNKSNTINNL